MKIPAVLLVLLSCMPTYAAPRFAAETPPPASNTLVDGAALCQTARETLRYLDQGPQYDPKVIQDGKVLRIPLSRVKATLAFICKHRNELRNPAFVQAHFDFVRWYPDTEATARPGLRNKLAANLPSDRVLMTRYYVHRAKASRQKTAATPFALYGLPADEQNLTLEEAHKIPGLIRFRYGKQAILRGALLREQVPALVWLGREDLESALLQGTVVTDLKTPGGQPVTLNVHRCNDIPWDRTKSPYAQERYWYFRAVDGIKGYGKDAENKITVNPKVTFAADLEAFGLGKLLMVQYRDPQKGMVNRMGILADTGGAFENNTYQVDFLTGTYPGNAAFYRANRHLPDYVSAWFMVLKS